jgi:hypothetical protein
MELRMPGAGTSYDVLSATAEESFIEDSGR